MGQGRPFSARRADGSSFLASIALRPLDIDGSSYVLAAVRDVTAQVQASRKATEISQRLESVAKLTRVGFWEIDLVTGARTYSSELLSILGLDAPHASDQELFESIHEEDRERVREAARVAIETEESPHFEFRVRDRDARWRWFEARSSVTRNEAGVASTLMGFALDVTTRRELHEQALRSERNLRTIVQEHPDAILIARDGVIVDCNQRAAELFDRVDAASLIGEPCPASTESDTLRITEKRTSDTGSGEWRVAAADGRTVIVETKSVAIDREGVQHQLTIARDVSAQRRAAEQLRVADRVLSLGMMAASVAHDINNPLAVVLANLALAEGSIRSGNPQSALDDLVQAREAAERVRDIVMDLKSFSRNDRSELEPVSIRRVIDAAVRIAHSELRHRARVSVDIDPRLGVSGSEPRLGQVFLNLLVNAAHAMPVGNVEGHLVEVFAELRSDTVTIAVRDNGTGIAPHDLSRMFSPFFTTREKVGGTGLGLATCQRLVREMAGDIEVESTLGVGTTFRVRLKRADLPNVSEVPSESLEIVLPGRILVVDDEIALGNAVARVLGIEHEVVVAVSAKDALETLARDRTFDLILCDLSMPEMTGHELLGELWRTYPELGPRVLFMSGGPITSGQHDFLTSVRGGYIQKPFDVTVLRRAVNRRISAERRRHSPA